MQKYKYSKIKKFKTFKNRRRNFLTYSESFIKIEIHISWVRIYYFQTKPIQLYFSFIIITPKRNSFLWMQKHFLMFKIKIHIVSIYACQLPYNMSPN